jgi:hypothetical protein
MGCIRRVSAWGRAGLCVAAVAISATASAADIVVPGSPLPAPAIFIDAGGLFSAQTRQAVGTPGADLPFAFTWEFGATASGTVHIDPSGAVQLSHFTFVNPSATNTTFVLMSFFTDPGGSFLVEPRDVIGSTFITGTFAKPNPPPMQSPLFGLPIFQAFVGERVGQFNGGIESGITFTASRPLTFPGSPTNVGLTDQLAVSVSPQNTLSIPLAEVRVSAIPEPSSYALMMVGLGIVALERRMVRAKAKR